MLRYGKSALGFVAQPRMAIALIAATVALGGTVSEASAKSKHRHHHKHHHHHVAKKAAAETNPFEANASIGPFMPEVSAPVRTGGRSVVVTVNDRGPFIRGRVLDLSKGAASAIGLTSRGVGKVVAEVM